MGFQRLDRDALLLHGVAVAHDDAAVGLGFKVERHAKRRADLVLPEVDETASAAADGSTVTITMEAQRLANTRAAVLRYYDVSLFVFEPIETTTEN